MNNKNDVIWNKKYELLKIYYEYYGNLLVTKDFKTLDGINKSNDENAFNLGVWINTQRKNYKNNKLSQEKIKLLEKIAMVWNLNTNKFNILSLLEKEEILVEYNEINKRILNNISYQEFYSKLMFLLENKIPIINDNNILNDIFTMSNKKLEEIYNISFEQLLNKYYYYNDLIKRKKVK